jgi:predicted TIM-barrel fold metal-dependent hydrolase
MPINVHTHVHNLAATFTDETLRTLLDRLLREGYPDVLVDRVRGLLASVLDRTETAPQPEVLLHRWLRDTVNAPSVQTYLDSLAPAERVQFEVLGSDLTEEIGLRAVAQVVDRVRTSLRDGAQEDARTKDLLDLIGFLHIVLQPSIRHVTRRLMDQQPDDGMVVALTLDITEGGDADRARYEHQLRQTSKQIFDYPGRFLPFVCVNTRRADAFVLMERALVAQGYVGVKLYPSLGYTVDSQAMRRVLAYCHERDVPMLMHCSPGGFFRTPQTIHLSAPEHWRPLLEAFPGLKVCFAHFGGADNLVQDPIPDDSWTQTILDLMGEFDGVYADISYNDAPMAGGEREAQYFTHLERLLDDPVRRDRILFGTDYFLIRMRLRESSFWAYFEDRLSAEAFERITDANPRRFLGLSARPDRLSWALDHHVRFVADNSERCAARPAPWLAQAIEDRFGDVTFAVSDLGPRWSRNNQAHWHLYWFLRDNEMRLDHRPPFEEAGSLRLRTLKYWTKEHDPGALFAAHRRAFAERIDMQLTTWGATYEAEYDRAQARSALDVFLDDGQHRVVDLGALCDRLYLFQQEQAQRFPSPPSDAS